MDSPLRISIVAADPLIRSSLAVQFEETNEYEVLDSSSPASFLSTNLEDLQQADADIILWDMGWESGNLDDLDFQALDLPVISLVANADQAVEAWNAGARAILSRESAVEDMLAAVRTAADGLLVLDPALTSSLLPSPSTLPDDPQRAPTSRELEVLQLLAEGLTNRAIANTLDISEHTVKFHVNSILTKLDAQSRTEAVVIATRLGLILL